MDLVVWTGPVAPFQVPGATVAGAKELFISCYGDRQPHCPTIGDQLMGSVESLALKAGLSEAQLGELFFGAFSAGGSVLKRLLSRAEYREATTAAHLADATYTAGWIDQAARIPPAIEGFVEYGVRVAAGSGDKLFVATASPSPNKSWATGVENLAAIRSEIEKRTGESFTLRPDFFGIEPAPAEAHQLGNVLFASYPMEPLGHGHAQIAPQVWQRIIQPWLVKGKGPIDAPGTVPPPPVGPPATEPSDGIGVAEILIGALSAVGGYLVVRRLWQRRS